MKTDFPIFDNNPGLVYLDSTSTTQKPQMVIDEITRFLSNDYANIHRGSYSLSERSEHIYEESKKITAKYIGASDWRELVYTYNSNYALNLLAGSLKRSNFFQKGDVVLVSIVEHHANIVPWLILKEEIGIEIEYIQVKEDFSLDFDDLESKLDERVKVVSLTHVSNVTGEIFDLERVGELIKNFKGGNKKTLNPSPVELRTGSYQGEKDSSLDKGRQGGVDISIPHLNPPLGGEEVKKTLFIVDGSQSVPHFQVDVAKIVCDFLFFTGHKVMADSGIGVLWGRREIFEKLSPIFSGGGAIRNVQEDSFIEAALPDRFETGTPNITGAASLLAAFRYIENIGGYEKIQEVEDELVIYSLRKFKYFSEKYVNFHLLGSQKVEGRVGVFSFYFEGIHSLDIADYMADNDICIRAGQHCAEPFLLSRDLQHTCRMSLYIYNTKEDIDLFFEVLEKAVLELKEICYENYMNTETCK